MHQATIRRIVSIGLLLVLVLIFGLTSSYFFTASNIYTLLRECATTGIIAVGVSFVIITAGIDLSTGALVGFVSMLSANLLYYTQLPASVIILISIIVGTLGGYLNGLLVTKLRLPDFIATLSTQFLFRGLALIFAIRTATGMISNKVITNRSILILGGSINGIYLATIAFLIIALVGQYILKRTKLGVYTYAVGANRKSSDLSGINSDKIKRAVFTITGFCCGVAALFLMGKMKSVTPDTGNGLEFDVIAAVVVGGCAFNGGRGDIVGTVIGALFMSVLTNGIYKYNLPTATQLIIKGSVIVIMIVFDSVYNKYMEEKIIKSNKRLEEAKEAPAV
jgi:ribose/xylose/arabinose/galactoside ABC-type transport system permease subunit